MMIVEGAARGFGKGIGVGTGNQLRCGAVKCLDPAGETRSDCFVGIKALVTVAAWDVGELDHLHG